MLLVVVVGFVYSLYTTSFAVLGLRTLQGTAMNDAPAVVLGQDPEACDRDRRRRGRRVRACRRRGQASPSPRRRQGSSGSPRCQEALLEHSRYQNRVLRIVRAPSPRLQQDHASAYHHHCRMSHDRQGSGRYHRHRLRGRHSFLQGR